MRKVLIALVLAGTFVTGGLFWQQSATASSCAPKNATVEISTIISANTNSTGGC